MMKSRNYMPLFLQIKGILLIFNLFKNDKLQRVAFLNQKQREQWNLIIDEVLPINVMISKYNSITGEMGLNASNQEAQSKFKISNDESFNEFMQRIRLDSPTSKRTLRDFILEKHHTISTQSKKILSPVAKTQVFSNRKSVNELKSFHENESPFDDLESIAPSRMDRNPSIKRLLTQRSIVGKRNNIAHEKDQKQLQDSEILCKNYFFIKRFFEILKGYYCDDWDNRPHLRCQYKIQVFQFSVNEPLLLISVEDNSVQEKMKILQISKKQYQDLFKDTLRFFQDRIVRLSTEIGQLAIPISQSNVYYDLKYSVMSIFTGIHNILDFVFEQGSNRRHLQSNSYSNKKELSPLKKPQKELFKEQNSLEEELEEIDRNNPPQSSNFNIQNFNSGSKSIKTQQKQGCNSIKDGVNGFSMGNTKIRRFSLRKLLTEINDVMSEKCKQKKVMFFFSDLLSEDNYMIQDQRRVKQVLFNYLQNALDCVNKGYISVTVRPFINQGLKTFRFDIMDSGTGVTDLNDEFGSLRYPFNEINNSNNPHIQVVSLRKKSAKNIRKLSSFSNYFQNITTANPQSKKKGLGIGMKVNQKIIAKLGPYFPKIFSESDTGTHIVYELYADIMAIHNFKNNFPRFIQRERREEDIPEEEEFIGLSCYKYTHNEIYHFSKNTKSTNILLSPDIELSPSNHQMNKTFNPNYNGPLQCQGQAIQPQINLFGSTASNYVSSMINLNTALNMPSNASSFISDNGNISMPQRLPSSLIQVDLPSRHRPDSLDNVNGIKITRSNLYSISNSQQNNNSFTIESFRSRDRSRHDSFFVDMNNRKRALNQASQQQNQQVLLNLNGSEDGTIHNNQIYYQNGSFPNTFSCNQIHLTPKNKLSLHSIHDLSNYS